MNKTLLSILVIAFFSVDISIFSQEKKEPPIPFETLFGNKRVAMSLAVNKSIGGKFRYNNISSAAAFYDYQKGKTELVSVNSIVYQFHKNVGISAGTQYHFIKGFIPTAAIHFSKANPTWLLVLTPYYNFMPWSNIETVAIAEYKPTLNKDWRLFTRLQGFYSHDFKKNERERTMLYFRLGATYQKYTLGIGGNIDGYRPERSFIQNYGGFFRIDI